MEKLNARELIRRAAACFGIRERSRSFSDYEKLKHYVSQLPVTPAEYDECIREICRYLEV